MPTALSPDLLAPIATVAARANPRRPDLADYPHGLFSRHHIVRIIAVKALPQSNGNRFRYKLVVADRTHSIDMLLDDASDDGSTRELLRSRAVSSRHRVYVRLVASDAGWPFVAVAGLRLLDQRTRRGRAVQHIQPPSALPAARAGSRNSRGVSHRSNHSNSSNKAHGTESGDSSRSSESSYNNNRRISGSQSASNRSSDDNGLNDATCDPSLNGTLDDEPEPTSKLDPKALHVENYVPLNLRAINEALATTMHVDAPAPMRIDQFTVPFTPQPFASTPMSELCPVRLVAPDDCFYYAIEHWRCKLNSKDGITADETKPLPLVDDIHDLQSYCQTFEELLMAERHEQALLYERYSRYDHPVWIRTQQDGPMNGAPFYTCYIDISGIAHANPPLQAGDAVLVRTMEPLCLPLDPAKGPASGTYPPSLIEIRSTIQSVQLKENRVQCLWLDSLRQNALSAATLVSQASSSRFNVRFVPRPTKHARCLSALDWLSKQPSEAVTPLLVPMEAPTLPSEATYLDDMETAISDLNMQQRDFVKLVLRRTLHAEFETIRSPMILTGPAGTGKTNTMIAAVLQVLAVTGQSAHILICTPSHAAADNIITRLGKHLGRQELFRLYDSSRAIETVPVHVLGYARQSGESGKFCLPTGRDLFSFKVIVSTCDDAHILYRAGLTNQQLRVRRNDFALYLNQACEACNLKSGLSGVDYIHFTHLFIDEAAQATEPESLIPLSVIVDTAAGYRKTEIALVGDPRQLSPSVYSSSAQVAGLGRSWIERLLLRPVGALGGGSSHMLGPDMSNMLDFIKLSFREELSIFLTINYRGHPSCLMMPSALFYYDKLKSAVPINNSIEWCERLRAIEDLSYPIFVSFTNRLPAESIPRLLRITKQYEWPIHLRAVNGQDRSVTVQSGFAGNSWQNKEEAQVLTEIVAKLTEKGVSTESIGVMVPFRAQVMLIRDLLRRRGLGGTNVGIVEDYQAVERDVILLSLTRCTYSLVENDIQARMGLFGQPKRANVAMTRAKHLFVVIGDPQTMIRDFIWRQFLLFCIRNGLLYGHDYEDDALYERLANKTVVRCKPEGQIEDDNEVVVLGSLERAYREKEN